MQYSVPSTGPHASPAAIKIGAFGTGANSTESAMMPMNTTGPRMPNPSTQSRNGSASMVYEMPKYWLVAQ